MKSQQVRTHRLVCALILLPFIIPIRTTESPDRFIQGEQISASNHCAPLPPPSGLTLTVSSVAQLENAVNAAVSGTTILVANGTYNLNGVYLLFDVPNVTLRSSSGDRQAVILDGNYITTEIIQITASNVTIADLTLREAYNHPIHVMSTASSNTVNTLIYNVHIIDPGQQAIKVNPAGPNFYPDDGIIACSRIELTDAGRSHIRDNCYTGGVDAHQGRDWVIRDNVIEGFWCQAGLSEHGIHLWRGCRETLVERNLLKNNARGIGFGLATSGPGRTYSDNPCPNASGYVDHFGGVIRNNMVFANSSGLFASGSGFDCGICLWNACNARVLNNTVYSTQAPFSSVEWRFPNSNPAVINNLVNYTMRERDGASGSQLSNLSNAQASWFVNSATGDLHLLPAATSAIDHAASQSDVTDDFDGDLRPVGSASDIGADELASSLSLAGIPGVQSIYLNWTVSNPIPTFNSWKISYTGPTGDQPSPVTGIPPSARMYTLTGLTNHVAYSVTLNAMLGSTPVLTDTVTATPSDIFIYLSLLVR